MPIMYWIIAIFALCFVITLVVGFGANQVKKQLDIRRMHEEKEQNG